MSTEVLLLLFFKGNQNVPEQADKQIVGRSVDCFPTTLQGKRNLQLVINFLFSDYKFGITL
jgi:hypothetical protein